jgi:hypothetical protein
MYLLRQNPRTLLSVGAVYEHSSLVRSRMPVIRTDVTSYTRTSVSYGRRLLLVHFVPIYELQTILRCQSATEISTGERDWEYSRSIPGA